VMYGGRVVEDGSTAQVLGAPRHPYTQALLSAIPGEEQPGQRLQSIRGAPQVLRESSPGCAFAPRCPRVLDRCAYVRPVHAPLPDGHAVCCHLMSVEAGNAPGGARPPLLSEAIARGPR
jgi:oligopeptide/dipeptide ABC transporter ATP-binding protein